LWREGRTQRVAEAGWDGPLSTTSGKLMRTIMAGLAECERDLIRERVKSVLQAAKEWIAGQPKRSNRACRHARRFTSGLRTNITTVERK
jgi:DNA invertase Pin-like site-specific DNA recombinase